MQSQHGFIQVDNSVFSALKDNKREHSSVTYIYCDHVQYWKQNN